VFDGHGPDEQHGPLAVRWAEDADTLIERLAAEHRRSEQVAVVSSDAAVRGTSGVEVRKLSSKTFLGELTPPAHQPNPPGDLRDRSTPPRWPSSSVYAAAADRTPVRIMLGPPQMGL
jgi:Predicted RNA-binding protein containing a PIN domain